MEDRDNSITELVNWKESWEDQGEDGEVTVVASSSAQYAFQLGFAS